ncbi:ATP-dependent DNA helicase pif1-like [Oscarella lobularis]|uniref:ATP-dependent DNA helicase pif1-like n=1 Tax=Oscarella lobularis TaxID=121494 RepID=UPI003314012F
MSEDYLRHSRTLTNNSNLPYNQGIFNRTIIYLEDKILSFSGGQPLTLHGLPSPDRTNELRDDLPREVAAEYAYDVNSLEEIVANRTPLLTDDQREAYQNILLLLDQQSTGHIVFLDALGGTRKTFLLNLLLAKVRTHSDIAIAVASSGIAATLLTGGKTAHSTFKLPLNLHNADQPTCATEKASAKAELLRLAKLIVWDECTMSHKKAFEALNTTLQDIRNNDLLMGGLTVVLAGDFRQKLPIIQKGTRADEIHACLKSSRTLRPHVRKLHLRKNMRVHRFQDENAGQYSDLLLRIGNGQLPRNPENGLITIPCGKLTPTLDELQDQVFPSLAQNYTDIHWLSERAILAPTNESVYLINDNLLKLIPTQERHYISIDTTVKIDDAVNYSTEFLNSLNPTGLPPYILTLKIGAPIMLLRNLDPPKLCNGTKLIVRQLRANVIEATIAVGQYEGEHVFLPRIPLIPSDTTIPFKRLQFPVRTCFAMTINKSQGQTLNTVGLYLASHCFSQRQFYVACSRVSTPENICILAETNETANVVYTEILS